MKITRVPTGNGKTFTDRLFGLRKRSPSRQHEFDLLCAELGIQHRFVPARRPQTDGVERFHGWIEDVVQSLRFYIWAKTQSRPSCAESTSATARSRNQP